jgi:hypothetical protein
MRDTYKRLLVKKLNEAFYDGEINEISGTYDDWDILWTRNDELELQRGERKLSKGLIITDERNTITLHSKDA